MKTLSIWEAYREEGDTSARERLLSQNLNLVHHIARQIARGIGGAVELDDLISAGTMGLVNAVENFEPARGLAFSTFAAPRIRGAILDELRRWDHAPRSLRRKARELHAASEKFRATHGREPEEAELAQELEVSLEQLWRWQAEVRGATLVSIDQPLNKESHGPSRTPLDLLVGDDASTTVDRLAYDQKIRIVQQEILSLKERERLVLSLYYQEELKLREIASILGLTESRISQIRSKALATLRGRLRQMREDRE